MKNLISSIFLLCLSSLILAETDLPKMNMTTDEIDKMLACAEIVTKAIHLDLKYQEKIGSLGIDPELANGKISSDMYYQCVTEIDKKAVNYFFNNITYANEVWSDEFIKYSKVNWEKYNNETDYNYTPEQMIQLTKLQQSREAFEEKQRSAHREANSSIKIGSFDINSIGPLYKGIFFLAVFSVFFIGLLYLLKAVRKEPKVSKKKKAN